MLRISLPNLDRDATESVQRVLASGQLAHGDECERFENELADYLGGGEVVIVSSGTAALHLALVALNIGPGDAVLVPDFTFPATANAVRLVGARPVLVDVAASSYCVTPSILRHTLDHWPGPEPIRAVMPVHEFGCPVDMTGLKQVATDFNLQVIEDAACALGASHAGSKLGLFGEIGCFSFHPRKTLTTGEGGALVTADAALAERLRRLRNHGMVRTEQGSEFVEVGFNYRMTNFQAALGRAQLPKLDGWISRRRELALHYRTLLAGVSEVRLPADVAGHSWQTFMMVLDDSVDRNALILKLREQGIEASVGAQAVSLQPAYRGSARAADAKTVSIAARLHRQGLALPFCEQYDEDVLAGVATTLCKSLHD